MYVTTLDNFVRTHAEKVDGVPDTAHATAQERLRLHVCKLVDSLAEAWRECRQKSGDTHRRSSLSKYFRAEARPSVGVRAIED